MSGHRQRSHRSETRPSPGLPVVLLLATLAIGPGGSKVRAQDRLEDFADRPILVLNTGGHHAPVYRLAFTPDEGRLLSAGLDKVVRVWDLESEPRKLAWTIRPRIWRGPAGAINAMALAPPDAQGRQTLALGGFGVESTRGEIGLYRFPGAPDRRQGDIERYIPTGEAVDALRNPIPPALSRGHLGPVTCLAFDPSGTVLASSSNDRTIRLWDYRTQAQLSSMTDPAQGRVNGLAFTPDGLRLATGGSDGTLRIWNVADRRRPVLHAQAPPPIKPGRELDVDGLAINALDVSRDGRWVVIGREDGLLLRYDLGAAPANFAAGMVVFATGELQGPVEGLAFGPDNQVATSIVSRRANPTERPTVSCDIELRQALAPREAARPLMAAPTTNLVYALAFSPNGKYLAFAGGDGQDISLLELKATPMRSINLSGSAVRGTSIWGVGFAGDGQVAYSYAKPAAEPPGVYWGFDLRERSRMSFPGNQVTGPIKDYQGWTVRPAGPYQLNVFRGQQPAFELKLSPDLDGRWWDYSFLPPGPDHQKPALAVACRMGVVVHRLEDNVRTRFLDGHNGPVYCLAPSADGKWLATGSSDQTVRLWSLAGVDTLAPLGAIFQRQGDKLVVEKVDPLGFADVGGLKDGDLVEELYLGPNKVGVDEFLSRYSTAPPNSYVQFKVRRKAADGVLGELIPAGTSKRDRPSLSLFVGFDREWVLWTYGGYYDASVAGDDQFLFWQVNRSTVANPQPTDTFPILTHEKSLRQPKSVPGNLIDAILGVPNVPPVPVVQAPPEPVRLVQDSTPPIVRPMAGAGGAPILDPASKGIDPGSALPDRISMRPGVFSLRVLIDYAKGQQPGPVEILLEGKTVRAPAVPAFDPATNTSSVEAAIPMTEPGLWVVGIKAANSLNFRRESAIRVNVEGPPPRRSGHLKMLTIAPTFKDPNLRLLQIPGSQADAKDLAPFFAGFAVDEAGDPFAFKDIDKDRLVGGDATGDRIRAALDGLSQDGFKQGDLVVVAVESYIVARRKASSFLVSDSQGLPPKPESMMSAEVVNSALETLSKNGCRVVVILDGALEDRARGLKPEVEEWARSLRNEHGIVTILTTARKPFAVGLHRPLAQSILDSIKYRIGPGGGPLMTLDDLREAIAVGVQGNSSRLAEAQVYIPNLLRPDVPILTRKPQPGADEVQARQ